MSSPATQFGYQDTGWDCYPGIGVLENPPKIIVRSGVEGLSVWHRFYFTDTETSRNHEYGNAVWNFLDFCWAEGPRDLTEINSEHVEAWEEELDHANAGHYVIAIQMCAIRRFLQYAVDSGLLSHTPFSAQALGVHVPAKGLVDIGASAPRIIPVFVEYLSAQNNRNTRQAYESALLRFFRFCESEQVNTIDAIDGPLLRRFIDTYSSDASDGIEVSRIASARRDMAAVRGYFDALVLEGVMETNKARAIKLPKSITGKGSTPVLVPELVSRIIDGIVLDKPADYRDRALIALMAYSLFRISASLRIRVSDYVMAAEHREITVVDKGSKRHTMPVHPVLQHYIDDYLMYAGLVDQPDAPLFQGSRPHTGKLSGRAFGRVGAWQMVQRRASAVGHIDPIGNHSFRASGITTYLANGGDLEEARKMAAHKSAETTRLYDRNVEAVDPDEAWRIDYP